MRPFAALRSWWAALLIALIQTPPQQLRGLNKNHNHDLKNIFKSAATMATISAGPFHDFWLTPPTSSAHSDAAGTAHRVEVLRPLRAFASHFLLRLQLWLWPIDVLPAVAAVA